MRVEHAGHFGNVIIRPQLQQPGFSLGFIHGVRGGWSSKFESDQQQDGRGQGQGSKYKKWFAITVVAAQHASQQHATYADFRRDGGGALKETGPGRNVHRGGHDEHEHTCGHEQCAFVLSGSPQA